MDKDTVFFGCLFVPVAQIVCEGNIVFSFAAVKVCDCWPVFRVGLEGTQQGKGHAAVYRAVSRVFTEGICIFAVEVGKVHAVRHGMLFLQLTYIFMD